MEQYVRTCLVCQQALSFRSKQDRGNALEKANPFKSMINLLRKTTVHLRRKEREEVKRYIAKTTGATRESTKAPTGESTMAPTGNHTYYYVRLMPVRLKQQNRLADTITPYKLSCNPSLSLSLLLGLSA